MTLLHGAETETDTYTGSPGVCQDWRLWTAQVGRKRFPRRANSGLALSPNMENRWLILMMKAPEPGRVKTRLGKDVGFEEAAALYRKFVEYLVRLLWGKQGHPWQCAIAYDPPEAEAQIRDWLGPLAHDDTNFFPQEQLDLGGRLEAAFERGFAAGATSVIALGADCLGVTAEEIQHSFEDLESHPLAMSPAEDGGYWLIGMSGRQYEIFREMPWSQPTLAAETRAKAARLGLEIAEGVEKIDVDTLDDLRRLPAKLLAEVGVRLPE